MAGEVGRKTIGRKWTKRTWDEPGEDPILKGSVTRGTKVDPLPRASGYRGT